MDVERRVRSMFRTAARDPIDPARGQVADRGCAHPVLGKTHDVKSLLSDLEEHGILRRHLANDTAVWEHIQKLNYLYLEEIQALLINRGEIVRKESTTAIEPLLDQNKSVMVRG